MVSELSATPDAPSEFHWTYILALCERIAKAMNDVPLANNYANDYRGQLSVAQESYKNRSEGAVEVLNPQRTWGEIQGIQLPEIIRQFGALVLEMPFH